MASDVDRGTIFASPVLSYNITRGNSELSIQLFPTPFGSGRPSVPVAQTVTIARLTSPISVDRAYQPLFLHKLHEYFRSIPRLTKQGDLIALALDTDDTQWNANVDNVAGSVEPIELPEHR